MTKKSSPRLRTEWLWCALVGFVLLLGIWWFPGERTTRSDTYSTAIEGKTVYFRLVDDLYGASRNQDLLAGALDWMDILCLLGPADDIGPRDWDALYDWVRGGGRLLYARRAMGPNVDLAPFPIEVSSAIEVGGEELDDESAPSLPSVNLGEAFRARSYPDDEFSTENETLLTSEPFRWHERGWIRGSGFEVLVRRAGLPVAVRRRVGRGVIVVVANDAIFSNAELADERHANAVLALRLLEECGVEGAIVFDESINAASAPKVFGILFDPILRHMTLQLVLVAVLFAWWRSRRLGPPRPLPLESRRSIREHAFALGNLHYKAGTGQHAVHHFLEYFQRELIGTRFTRRSRAGRELRATAEWLARAADADADEVLRALEEADRAINSGRLSSGDTASVIRALARIKQRIESSQGA